MDTLSHATNNFGIFTKLADYGALGLGVLAMGYVAWFFIKRNLADKDKLEQRIKELENEKRNSL
jgi:hypothetical protein